MLTKFLFSHFTAFLLPGMCGCPARLSSCNVGWAVSLALGEDCKQGTLSRAGICALWIHGDTRCTAGTGGRMSTIVCQGIMSAQCESQLETWHNRIAVCTHARGAGSPRDSQHFPLPVGLLVWSALMQGLMWCLIGRVGNRFWLKLFSCMSRENSLQKEKEQRSFHAHAKKCGKNTLQLHQFSLPLWLYWTREEMGAQGSYIEEMTFWSPREKQFVQKLTVTY